MNAIFDFSGLNNNLNMTVKISIRKAQIIF
jgi:hypothetical protein